MKAKSARVTKEKTEMAKIFKAFVKKHETGGRTVFVKTLKFYLDSLDEFDFGKLLAGLEEEIKETKRQIEETTKIEMIRIKNFQELMGSPDQHFKSMQEATDKLLQ